MESLIIASMGKSAGKTSLMIGMGKAWGVNFGYIKPLGDRLVYHKKRLWDYDSALLSHIFRLEESPEDMTIGFEHAKLQFMYDGQGRKAKLLEMASHIGKDKKLLWVEGGKDLRYGISVGLDPVSIARDMGGKLVIVISGPDDSILDDVTFLKKNVDLEGIHFSGVILNKIQNPEDFRETGLKQILQMGFKVLGILPYRAELAYPRVQHLVDALFAKVIGGEKGLDRQIKNTFVGSMSANFVMRNPLFNKEKMLVITSGDRTDILLSSLNADTSCLVLTNNILPPSAIISRANDKNVPLLLVTQDTYQAVRRIDQIEPLCLKDDTPRIEALGELVKECLSSKDLIAE